MNYGYNITSDIALSSFLAFSAQRVSVNIMNTSFEYNIALSTALLYLARVKTLTLDKCKFEFNIGGNDASVIQISTEDQALLDENTGLLNIRITNSEFINNGSISGPAVMSIFFPEGVPLHSILLEGNVFKHNSSHSFQPVVKIENNQIEPEHVNGSSSIYMIMRKNTFEENGSH